MCVLRDRWSSRRYQLELYTNGGGVECRIDWARGACLVITLGCTGPGPRSYFLEKFVVQVSGLL